MTTQPVRGDMEHPRERAERERAEGRKPTEGLTTLYLTRTEGSVSSGHAQLVPSGIEDALAARDIVMGDVGAANKVVYTVRLADGTTREIVQGSTNSIWMQHQKEGPDAEFFKKLLDVTAQGKTIALTVVDIKGAGGRRSHPGEVVKF